MKIIEEKGLTLVELLMAIMILGMIAVAITTFLSSAIQAQASGNKKSALYREGLLAMERMTNGVRRCTFLLIPNANTPSRDILAFSGFINDDDDYYFDDPLFPRIDEDLDSDMVDDGNDGIMGIDDDGDGLVDEGFWGTDDDEGGFADEDPVDGIDNDGDGNIDEDCWWDINADGEPGIAGMDDDGDGQVDEGHQGDDDEDGSLTEVGLVPVLYTYNSGTDTLTKSVPYTGESVDLSTHVTQFQVTYEAPERLRIELTLTGDEGESITFTEYVYPRNTLQKTGKRAR